MRLHYLQHGPFEGDEMVPGDCVQSAEEILSHPEYIQQCNDWRDMFLTQLLKIQKARIWQYE